MKQIRIGIDVGGTFTHAVALDAHNAILVGKVKVPTTHTADNGVGEGIVSSLEKLMEQCEIAAKDIVSVAHSTTQATNSLLEGDVERVGIITLGFGISGKIASKLGNLGDIELAPQRYLKTVHRHLNLDEDAANVLQQHLLAFKQENIRVVVVGELFSSMNSEHEKKVSQAIAEKGFWSVASADIAQLFGFKVRLRTAAINMSLLPKMLDVAEHTEKGIRALGVTAPLMIMRSDGGVMSLEEMRKKPILTLLSGPAAGIAAALRYLRISDGVFLEVGGTSTDISVIRNGRAMVRTAVLGGKRLFLETLDCRTVGIGGGSMLRLSGSNIKDVGPRSAHIAGVGYAAFSQADVYSEVKADLVAPKEGDPADYVILKSQKQRFTFTPTCAANALGLVPQNDCAHGSKPFHDGVKKMFANLGWGDVNAFCKKLLTLATDKVIATMNPFMKEYALDKQFASVIGGGGGAASIVPYVAHRVGMSFEIARDNDVISAIGAALGLIRVVVEQSVVNPSAEDIMRIRAQAHRQTMEQGAQAETIEVFVEVDNKKNIIRAEAQGAMEYSPAALKTQILSPAELEAEILKTVGGKGYSCVQTESTEHLEAFLLSKDTSRFFGLLKDSHRMAIAADRRGVIRLRVPNAYLFATQASEATSKFLKHTHELAEYGDGGIIYPFCYVLKGERIIDLSKLGSPQIAAQLLEVELRETKAEENIVLIMSFDNTGE